MIERCYSKDLTSPRIPFSNEERYAMFLEKLTLLQREKSAPVIPPQTQH